MLIKQYILACENDVDDAIRAAKEAWPEWSKTPVLRRARILDKFKNILWERLNQLAEVISSEHGKTIDDAITKFLEKTKTIPTLSANLIISLSFFDPDG